MAEVRYNNSVGQLGAPMGASDTSITFTGSPGWATLAGGDYIKLEIDPTLGSATPSPNPLFEIVYVTAYTGGASTATIERGQEGTTPQTHAVNAVWINGPTAADFAMESALEVTDGVTSVTAATEIEFPSFAEVTNAGGGVAQVQVVGGATERVNTVATSGSAQTIPAVTAATISDITLSANCALTFPSTAAGERFTLQVVQPASGGPFSVTWPGSGVVWVAGSAPTQATAANKRDLYSFACFDGTNWVGSQLSPSGGY